MIPFITSKGEAHEGWPAFPGETLTHVPTPGMTLRDWFAGRVMEANFGCDEAMKWFMRGADNNKPAAYATIAKDSYEMADAMLAERKRQPEIGGTK